MYARKSLALESRFVAAISVVLTRVSNYPKQGNPTVLGCRWMKTAKFRYIIYYREISSVTIQVFAIAHGSRRPGYWLRRTRRP